MIRRFGVLVFVAACARPADTEVAADLTRASTAMDSVYAAFSAGYAALDPGAVADLYTPDARYLSPGGEIRHGRDSIAASFADFFERVRAQGQRLEIHFDSDDRGASGDLGYDIGYYRMERFAGDSLLGSGRGKFVTVWHRGADGRWRIHADGYNEAP